jgi:hypothetical protein
LNWNKVDSPEVPSAPKEFFSIKKKKTQKRKQKTSFFFSRLSYQILR